MLSIAGGRVDGLQAQRQCVAAGPALHPMARGLSPGSPAISEIESLRRVALLLDLTAPPASTT